MGDGVRAWSPAEAAALGPGARHYRAFVGPPERYDLIGASQFALLFLLGLREHHRVLDFGCGSLRFGRLAVPYLLADRYFGIEPEAWLVEDGFSRELGLDARALKRPRFSYNDDYRCDVFGERFDFVMAQSVFSHTGSEPATKALRSMAGTLAPGGLVVANWWFASPEAGPDPASVDWVYPGCVPFEEQAVSRMAEAAGLVARTCRWPHPLLTWVLMAAREEDLPSEAFCAALGVPPSARA